MHNVTAVTAMAAASIIILIAVSITNNPVNIFFKGEPL